MCVVHVDPGTIYSPVLIVDRSNGSKNELSRLFLPTSGLDRKSAAPLTTQRGKRDSWRDCRGVVRFAALLSGITTRRSQRRGTLHRNKRFLACVARAPSRPPPPPLHSFRRHLDQVSWTCGFIFDKSLSLFFMDEQFLRKLLHVDEERFKTFMYSWIQICITL